MCSQPPYQGDDFYCDVAIPRTVPMDDVHEYGLVRASQRRDQGDDFCCDGAVPRTVPLEVVHADDLVLAYHHTRPCWRVHLVAVPKRHIASFTTVAPTDETDVRALLSVVQRLARQVE